MKTSSNIYSLIRRQYNIYCLFYGQLPKDDNEIGIRNADTVRFAILLYIRLLKKIVDNVC